MPTSLLDASRPSEHTPALLARERMRDKLQTREGKALYARRKSTVEPVLGQIKGARGLAPLPLQGTRRVDARLPHPQPAQALPFEARDRRERLTRAIIGTGTRTGTRTGVA